MRLLLHLIVLAGVLFSCTEERNNFVVEYTAETAENRQMYLSRQTLSGPVAVDSAMPGKSGAYTFKGYTLIPDFFILYFQPGQYINLIIHPGDHITISGNSAAFDHGYYVEGSKDSRLVQKMVSNQAAALREITAISTEFENSRDNPDFESIKARIDSTYDQIVKEHRRFSVELIEQNPGSLAGLMALYQQLGRNIPVFDYKNDFKYFAMVDSSLSALYPDSEAVRDLNRRVTEIRRMLRIDIGSPAPDIVLPDTTGTVIALSSLKGNMVLLYFYASWSPESQRQHDILTGLYAQYADRHVEYYQVSLDRTKESWLNYLRDEKPAGIQVSDLEYWDSPVVEAYMLEAIPQLYLLDQEGRIVDKGFTPEEADAKISAFLFSQ
ncbi:MAG: AhpC/TSA family protein [Bacteroidales bacterium]|nr:AhpC/TSA family protein [Bacteroidales bacterium]